MSSDSSHFTGGGSKPSAGAHGRLGRRDRLRGQPSGTPATTTRAAREGAQVLCFNWRDADHPSAGGAEVFTHEVLERLVERGYDATLFSAAFDGCEPETTINGVDVVRGGGSYSVYGKAARYYRRAGEQYDLVIDEINGPPFFTPAYADVPVVALVHHVVEDGWYTELPFPAGVVGEYLQDWWLKVYRSIPTMTVSTSSARDLEARGFEDVRVVPQGIDQEPLQSVPEKPDRPTFAYLGRMSNAKRPGHTLRAFEHLKDHYPRAQLHMMGDGYLLDDLRERAGEGVTFHGYVSEERKQELLQQSHLLLVTSVKEGWGLVVTEANAMGTPAVGYNVKGLRDSIRAGENGLLATEDPLRLAQRAVTVLERGYDRYASRSIDVAQRHDWERTTDAVERTIGEVLQ